MLWDAMGASGLLTQLCCTLSLVCLPLQLTVPSQWHCGAMLCDDVCAADRKPLALQLRQLQKDAVLRVMQQLLCTCMFVRQVFPVLLRLVYPPPSTGCAGVLLVASGGPGGNIVMVCICCLSSCVYGCKGMTVRLLAAAAMALLCRLFT